jgi:GTP-binding protein Era
VAIIGRPNVGKSTLLNQLMQQKLSITSRKPQTTRHRIVGVHTMDNYQTVYVDTPGIHSRETNTLNRLMNQAALSVLGDVDVVVVVVDCTRWTEDDEDVFSLLPQVSVPCYLVVNKVDKLADKSALLPLLQRLSEKHAFKEIIPLSAKTGDQVAHLDACLRPLLPESPHLFAADQFTDRSTRFLCAELVREKIFRLCGEELPYSTTVEIESYQETDELITIHALIWVEKSGHKRMIIGEKGAKLKAMATNARLDMEQLLGKRVFLRCWCKVKSGWSDNERLLKQLGYDH